MGDGRISVPERVVLAMSGGVDSSVSAHLLKREGYEVIGLFMRSGASEVAHCVSDSDRTLPVVDPKGHKQGCCSAADAADARRAADMLDIPFYALNFQDAFRRIKDYFAEEYLAGWTPNPCVMCNNWLKFGRLWSFARQVGADRIATGHYARIRPEHNDKPPSLVRGIDRWKDQSYVLFGIDRGLLDRILFPVGDFTKPEIRRLAHDIGLRLAEKPDSQEICFVPEGDYAKFIERHYGPVDTAGELVDTAGNVVGRHNGYEHFTIGQRKGLGVTFGSPRYVVRIEADTNRVVIGHKQDLGRMELEADRVNWLVSEVSSRFTCTAQIRYQHNEASADVLLLERDRIRVRFLEPQFGVAPGQAVVLYEGERVLGGGWIC